MAYEIVMPQLGISMDSGEIIRWLKQSGERVEIGDLLLEVESDKSVVEVEAVKSGILHVVSGPDAGEIPVGEVIGYLLAEGESPPPRDEPMTKPTAQTISVPEVEQEPTAPPVTAVTSEAQNWPRPNRPPSSPAARRRAKELGVDWRMAAGSGPGGRIKERDVVRLAASDVTAAGPVPPEAVQISPVAQRLIESVGLDTH
jgi:pyruvate dehydrogenase E2 component (dihydrolipoamide acetyltransferase)